jgi:hypothetical protein
VIGYTPVEVGESAEWTAIVSDVEENRANYFKVLSGKTFFSALYETYTVNLNELETMLKASTTAGKTNTQKVTEKPTQEEGFQEVRRSKRHSTKETAPTSKRAVLTAASTAVSTPPPPQESRHPKLFRSPQGNGYGHGSFRCRGHSTWGGSS